jgi:TonB-like protein
MFAARDNMTHPQRILALVLTLACATTACGAARSQPVPFTGQIDQPPDRGACPRPERPLNAGHLPGTDTVLTQFVLDTTGHVAPGTMKILRSTDPLLNMAATLVVQRCRYTPARQDGHPVPMIIQQPVYF